jgi:hypothetical protein
MVFILKLIVYNDNSNNVHTRTGLPDGLFSNQRSKFGLILEVLAMEDVGIFYVPMDT